MADTTLEESLKDIESRCDAIEACYEFMLAYACLLYTSDAADE